MWAVCRGPLHGSGGTSGGDTLAVVHLGVDGTVQSVELPGISSNYTSDIHRMFPPEVQGRYFGKLIDFQGLSEHLRWRLEHPEEPPLIVLGATPAP